MAVVTHEALLKRLTELISKGYTPGDSVWDLSISYVEYDCTEQYDLMYTRDDAPKRIPRLFALRSL